jgi:hypothetical protein
MLLSLPENFNNPVKLCCSQMYLGSQMMLVVCDPEVARRLNYKMINRQIGNQLRLGQKDDQFAFQGLVAAK